jgi:hypothetical protein
MTGQETPSIRVELPAFSQFTSTTTYQIPAELDSGKENVVVFGLKRDAIVPDPSDIMFTVPGRGRGRLDLVSQHFYGTPELWWAIAQCNPGMDPFIGPEVTQVIRVPAKNRLATLGVLSV